MTDGASFMGMPIHFAGPGELRDLAALSLRGLEHALATSSSNRGLT